MVQQAVIEDLAKSGLSPADIDARDAQSVEFGALGISAASQGYVLPYFDLYGKNRSFYRVKLFNANVKYRQPKNTSNNIYFPKGLQKCIKESGAKYIIVTEGEKKAAAAVKMGIPCVALGGVDSWKNRTFILPEGTELGKSYNAKDVNAKIPAGIDDIGESGLTTLAVGFTELVDYCVSKKMHLVVCFDTDDAGDVKFEVQRAAASFAFELRYQGMPYGNIHQLVLPAPADSGKVGLDDFLVANGPDALLSRIQAMFDSGSSFPEHPNVKEYVNRKLQKTKMTRKEAQNAAMALLSDLDSRGRRLYSENEDRMYYFEGETKRLMRFVINEGNKNVLHGSDFGKLLYNRYGLSAADGRVLTWLEAQFYAEQPIEAVDPHRIIARPRPGEDVIRYQINDGQYVKVDGSRTPDDGSFPITVHDNGDEGFLFESGLVEPIEADALMKQIEDQRTKPLTPWWLDVLNTVRLKDDDKNKVLISFLYYISPWLYKWRGAQLPVELVIGESGSGKSSLCEHRLNIVTGTPDLRNAPTDLKDWHASITNAGGLHVVDNVNLVDKNLRQRLSDEICRLVTEPDPHIEMRKLYSNNELIRIPARVVFCLTAIQQPFMQADLLQRAVLVELDKNASAGTDGSITYEYNWVNDQMERFGGREAWLAHHLLVLKRFFDVVREEWNPRYAAAHRLINLEQSLLLVAKVFGEDGSWLPEFMSKSSARSISEADWALEGLKVFATQWKKMKGDERFSAGQISDWAKMQEEYEDCIQLTNSRKLGRYMMSYLQLVKELTGINKGPKSNNKQMYYIP